MEKIEEIRKTIDAIDREMALLFEKRMEAVSLIARYKAKNGIAVYDAKREADVIEKNAAYVPEEPLRPYYRRYIINVMEISKDYQNELMRNMP